MNGNEYQQYAMRTNDGNSTLRLSRKVEECLFGEVDPCGDPDMKVGDILNGCLGLSGEAGETLDMIKKWIFHEKDLDKDHLKKEIGDVMWYVAMICHGCGFDLDEILQMNVDKLRARYPEGFDTVRANNRAEGDI